MTIGQTLTNSQSITRRRGKKFIFEKKIFFKETEWKVNKLQIRISDFRVENEIFIKILKKYVSVYSVLYSISEQRRGREDSDR